jgi:hypothetical protein
MIVTLENFPTVVLTHAERMRELIQILQNAPLSHVVQATTALKEEVEALAASAHRAANRHMDSYSADIRYSVSDDKKTVTFSATSPRGRAWMGRAEKTIPSEDAPTYRESAAKAGMAVFVATD